VEQRSTTLFRAPREPSALFVRACGAKEGRGVSPHPLTNFLKKVGSKTSKSSAKNSL